MMKAERLKWVDMDYRNHLQAWLGVAAKAEKKAGRNKTKPIYSTFDKFYDYESALEKARQGNSSGGKVRFRKLAEFLKKGGADNG